MQLISSAIEVAHSLLRNRLATAQTIVDATAGNGGDTLFLAENSPTTAKIYAFDIQAEALAATKEHTKRYAAKINCILDSHAAVDAYVGGEIDAAIFNLGYLPGGSHAVTTDKTSTLTAVQKMLEKLSLNGVLIIVAYPGHTAGCMEKQALETYFEDLPMQRFTVGCYKLLNHGLRAPNLYVIEKVRR